MVVVVYTFADRSEPPEEAAAAAAGCYVLPDHGCDEVIFATHIYRHKAQQ